MPAASSSWRSVSPRTSRLAWVRLITRPAPWQLDPNDSVMLRAVPSSTRLAQRAIFGRQALETGPESARGPLAVDAHLHPLPVDLVRLDLAHVVRDVVNLVQIPIGQLALEHLGKTLARQVRQNLPVAESEIGSGLHGAQVAAAFRRMERRAHQLPVGQVDAVALDYALEQVDIVGP